MNESFFSALALAIVIATAMALFMRLIRQPIIIGHILTGIIVGPSVLAILKSPDTINVFSNLGVTLLLFIIGLGLNPKVIKEIGKVAAAVGLIQVAIIAGFGLWVGQALGLDYRQSLLLGVALSFSSTIIILKLLSDKREQNRLFGKITIGILIFQDLIAAFALLFLTSQGSNINFSASALGTLAAKGILGGAVILIVGNVLIAKAHRFVAASQEFLFLFAIGWGFGCAALFQLMGFSLEIGALLGGVALASLPFAQEISSRLRPLRDFFIVVFFISLGTRLSLSSLQSELPLILVASLIVIVLKPLIVMLIMGIMGYTKQTTFKTALTLGQVSEFSLILVVLANQAGIVDNNFVNAITLVALASIAISAYLINYSQGLFNRFERQLSLLERSSALTLNENVKHHYDLVLFGYKRGGHEFLKLFRDLGKKFVVIDYDPEVIEILEQQRVNCIYGDATDVELLQEIGIDQAQLIISTLSDHDSNVFLLRLVDKINAKAIVVVQADDVHKANELYDIGASYVVIPHYVGNEKIGNFIRRNGLKKSEFKKYHDKHREYLNSHYVLGADI